MSEHKNIAAALAAAVGEVRILGKSERNKFDGYNFVSIDKFLELVNPICAKHGLFPLVSQDEIELYENVNSKGGKATWARFYFSISLHHSTGESIGPVKSMVAVPMNGAQASGSAQSYALKQFFRATLMIPTGDKDDADLNPTEQHHAAPKSQPAKKITAEQFQKIQALVFATQTPEEKICAYMQVNNLHEMTEKQATDAIAMLNKKLAKLEEANGTTE